MKLERRGYEDRAVKEIRSAFTKEGRVLAVGPTGCGKTVVASMVIRRWPGRVLFLAHRYELVDQAYKTLRALDVDAAVLMAQDEHLHARGNPEARVQVASVQTVDRRGLPDGISLIVYDEAHRVMADSYQRVATAAPKARALGLTATPVRMDGRGLGEFFGSMVTIAKPSELYADGYLARPRTFTTPTSVLPRLLARLKGVRSSMGDYAANAIARAMDTSVLIGNVVSESKRIAPRVPKVVFASGVAHSRRIVAGFRAERIRAEHLDAATDPQERERILADLAAGRTEVVSNVDVLSEGWDLPALGAVVLARPTRSLGRYLQMVGRVQRPWKDRVPVVIDHGNNAIRHGRLPDEDIDWSLDSGVEREAAAVPVMKSCVGCALVIPGGCTTCPDCGVDQPMDRREAEKQEIAARLEEANRKRIDEIRGRVLAVAKTKGATRGWVERVVAGLAG